MNDFKGIDLSRENVFQEGVGTDNIVLIIPRSSYRTFEIFAEDMKENLKQNPKDDYYISLTGTFKRINKEGFLEDKL